MIDSLAAVVLGFALLALLGRGDRTRISAVWIAIVGFACLATFCVWKRVQLRQSPGPVYYELPAAPGPHRITLVKPGLSPGYRVQLVRRADRRIDKDLSGQLSLCHWRIVKCEKEALTKRTFDQDGVIEFNSEYPDVVLQYEAAPQAQALLETAAVELRCPVGFQESMGKWLAMLNLRIAIFLGGLILAGLFAWVQRRKLRSAGFAGTAAPLSSPPLTR